TRYDDWRTKPICVAAWGGRKTVIRLLYHAGYHGGLRWVELGRHIKLAPGDHGGEYIKCYTSIFFISPVKLRRAASAGAPFRVRVVLDALAIQESYHRAGFYRTERMFKKLEVLSGELRDQYFLKRGLLTLIYCGCREGVIMLLEGGADPNTAYDNGMTS